MLMLVIGSALREISNEQERLGMEFLELASTAPKYRLYSVRDRWAVLVEDRERGVSVVGELVEVTEDRVGALSADEPEGIHLDDVELHDGRIVKAALGRSGVLRNDAIDITEYGGFAAYMRARDVDRSCRTLRLPML
jgi:hypothetical protein